jgi:hypothetical protein
VRAAGGAASAASAGRGRAGASRGVRGERAASAGQGRAGGAASSGGRAGGRARRDELGDGGRAAALLEMDERERARRCARRPDGRLTSSIFVGLSKADDNRGRLLTYFRRPD